MLRLAVTLILLLLMLFGGAVWLLDMQPRTARACRKAGQRAVPGKPERRRRGPPDGGKDAVDAVQEALPAAETG